MLSKREALALAALLGLTLLRAVLDHAFEVVEQKINGEVPRA